MKKRISKSSCYVVLAAMLVFTLAQLVSQNAKGAQSQVGKLEGTWRVTSIPVDCSSGLPIPNGPSTQALNTYIQGGSMLETGNGSLFRTPGHGTWQHVGGRDFTAKLSFFRFNSSGTFVGTVTATKAISLGEDDNEFSATVTVDIRNVDGTMGHLCTAEMGARFE